VELHARDFHLIAPQVDFSSTEWVFSPIVQSGGKYDLKVSAMSNEDNLKPGIILATLGIRYKSYCSAMARTFMISPAKACSTVAWRIT
jgi:nucleosome binding factor SPN SPT16 subunit